MLNTSSTRIRWNALTHMHLQTSKSMPQYSQILTGDAEKKWNRRIKRERKDIAAYYKLIRSGEIDGYGREQASIAHRYGVVTTASEARTRIKNLTATSEFQFK